MFRKFSIVFMFRCSCSSYWRFRSNCTPDDDTDGGVPPAAEPGSSDGSVPDEERLTRAVLSLLKGSPMKMMGAELLVGALHREGVTIGYQALLAWLNRQKALFRLYPSGNGTLVAMV